MSSNDEISERDLITRREAVLRVTAILGGTALVGGSALLTACRDESARYVGNELFTADEVHLLDEVAETILPETKTPGAKAAKTGAFMALMVRDTYSPRDQQIFKAGIPAIDAAMQTAHNTTFIKATPEQRLSVITQLDKAQKAFMETRAEQIKKAKEEQLKDQRKEAAPGSDAGAVTAIVEDPPAHYFRMMKELTLLGYFTSEVGVTQGLRYVESPGRYDPCVAYHPGDKAWASHA